MTSTSPLLAKFWVLQLLSIARAAPPYSNGFFYHDFTNRSGNGEIYFNGMRLHVESGVSPIYARLWSNVTLPCRYWYDPELSTSRRTRVKWSWLPAAGGREANVLVVSGSRQRSLGRFQGRVRLWQESPGEASLHIAPLHAEDAGCYRCVVVDGLEDESATVELQLEGVVFPYQPASGRYRLNFLEAGRACEEQGAALATFPQLFAAWEEGLDWCNAGWLADGSVQYPITRPRPHCGGVGLAAGVRSYGMRHKHLDHYDAFCVSTPLKGRVYFLQGSHGLNFTQAVHACMEDGAEIAKVGQLYAAWRFAGLDCCDAGWIADGSLRYPIAKPRPNCGPLEPGMRNLGFPAPSHKHRVFCYHAL